MFFNHYRGLKEHLLEILPRLLEADPKKGMKFDELFQAMEKIKEMKVGEEDLSDVPLQVSTMR